MTSTMSTWRSNQLSYNPMLSFPMQLYKYITQSEKLQALFFFFLTSKTEARVSFCFACIHMLYAPPEGVTPPSGFIAKEENAPSPPGFAVPCTNSPKRLPVKCSSIKNILWASPSSCQPSGV